MTDAPLPNTPEARTPTGELLDASTTPTTTDSTTTNPTPSEAPVVPDKYDFKAPEGQTLDPATIEAASPLFKELGLSNEAAQKLVDFYSAQTAKTNEAIAETVDKMRSEWRDKITADPVLGKNLDAVKTDLGRMKSQLAPEVRTAFDEAMNTTGMGDHPAIVRGLYEIAKLVNEGAHVTGGAPSPHGQSKSGTSNRPTLAGAMYPNLPQ